MNTSASNSEFESAVLSRIVDPQRGSWPPEAAQAILSLTMPSNDRQKMDLLASKAANGTLTPDEELEIEGYRQVCRLLDLLKARARASLTQSSAA